VWESAGSGGATSEGLEPGGMAVRGACMSKELYERDTHPAAHAAPRRLRCRVLGPHGRNGRTRALTAHAFTPWHLAHIVLSPPHSLRERGGEGERTEHGTQAQDKAHKRDEDLAALFLREL
jgi:hypothetical protein